MKVAFITTNYVKIYKNVKKGTEIFDYSLIRGLSKYKKKVKLTVFASGNTKLGVPVVSVNHLPSLDDKNIGEKYHNYFELALLSKAFSLSKNFDLYHSNSGIGELTLPFARFIKKPILITLHGPLTERYIARLYAIYKSLPNIYFVSISNYQRKKIPTHNFIRTIYHGIDTESDFHFSPVGGREIMWSGRGIPEKGLEHILTVVKKTKKKAKLFPIIKEEYLSWLQHEIIKKRNLINQVVSIGINFDVSRTELDQNYQTSRLFLNPVEVEEGFGFTMVESMACGTPVVAYAKGSVPEVVKDGITGFVVNSSSADIRGNFIIKKTGIEGLCEAVERIYSMPEAQYSQMRLACRKHVVDNFTVDQMAENYVKVYEEILHKHKK